MARHHYLGHLNKIGESIWYIALWRDRWVAQLSMSAAALKCGVRDRWIGWDFRTHYDRLCLIANNSRILILPDWHLPNVGSHKNTGAKSFESALGITSLTPSKAPPKRVLNINSEH